MPKQLTFSTILNTNSRIIEIYVCYYVLIKIGKLPKLITQATSLICDCSNSYLNVGQSQLIELILIETNCPNLGWVRVSSKFGKKRASYKV